ncbi:hypothetical protein [Streptacidiphilus sp. PAMC 29251]
MNVEELLALLEQDPAPSVGRAAVAALVPEVHRIPRARLQAWLSPEQRPKLRAHAAVLLRATDPWTRLETDLRLLTDPDPDLIRAAGADLHIWIGLTSLGPDVPSAEQAALVESLLASADAVLSGPALRQLHFRFPRHSP